VAVVDAYSPGTGRHRLLFDHVSPEEEEAAASGAEEGEGEEGGSSGRLVDPAASLPAAWVLLEPMLLAAADVTGQVIAAAGRAGEAVAARDGSCVLGPASPAAALACVRAHAAARRWCASTSGCTARLWPDEPLVCLCRLPDRGGEAMLECPRCADWYHPACVAADADEVTVAGDAWLCPVCVADLRGGRASRDEWLVTGPDGVRLPVAAVPRRPVWWAAHTPAADTGGAASAAPAPAAASLGSGFWRQGLPVAALRTLSARRPVDTDSPGLALVTRQARARRVAASAARQASLGRRIRDLITETTGSHGRRSAPAGADGDGDGQAAAGTSDAAADVVFASAARAAASPLSGSAEALDVVVAACSGAAPRPSAVALPAGSVPLAVARRAREAALLRRHHVLSARLPPRFARSERRWVFEGRSGGGGWVCERTRLLAEVRSALPYWVAWRRERRQRRSALWRGIGSSTQRRSARRRRKQLALLAGILGCEGVAAGLELERLAAEARRRLDVGPEAERLPGAVILPAAGEETGRCPEGTAETGARAPVAALAALPAASASSSSSSADPARVGEPAEPPGVVVTERVRWAPAFYSTSESDEDTDDDDAEADSLAQLYHATTAGCPAPVLAARLCRADPLIRRTALLHDPSTGAEEPRQSDWGRRLASAVLYTGSHGLDRAVAVGDAFVVTMKGLRAGLEGIDASPPCDFEHCLASWLLPSSQDPDAFVEGLHRAGSAAAAAPAQAWDADGDAAASSPSPADLVAATMPPQLRSHGLNTRAGIALLRGVAARSLPPRSGSPRPLSGLRHTPWAAVRLRTSAGGDTASVGFGIPAPLPPPSSSGSWSQIPDDDVGRAGSILTGRDGAAALDSVTLLEPALEVTSALPTEASVAVGTPGGATARRAGLALALVTMACLRRLCAEADAQGSGGTSAQSVRPDGDTRASAAAPPGARSPPKDRHHNGLAAPTGATVPAAWTPWVGSAFAAAVVESPAGFDVLGLHRLSGGGASGPPDAPVPSCSRESVLAAELAASTVVAVEADRCPRLSGSLRIRPAVAIVAGPARLVVRVGETDPAAIAVGCTVPVVSAPPPRGRSDPGASDGDGSDEEAQTAAAARRRPASARRSSRPGGGRATGALPAGRLAPRAAGAAAAAVPQASSAAEATRFGRSGLHSWGVFAARPIAAGDAVAEYTGVVVSQTVADRLQRLHTAEGRADYLFRLSRHDVLDGTRCGGAARYVNHSCEPNCITQRVAGGADARVGRRGAGMLRVWLYARRAIAAGEELTYDYKLSAEGGAMGTCHCGAPGCRGTMV